MVVSVGMLFRGEGGTIVGYWTGASTAPDYVPLVWTLDSLVVAFFFALTIDYNGGPHYPDNKDGMCPFCASYQVAIQKFWNESRFFLFFILKQTKKKREKRESLENERAHVCAQIYHRDPQVLLCLAAFLCVLTHLWNVADKFWRTWRQKKNVERFSFFLPKKKKMKRETGQKNVSCTVVTNDKCCHSLHHYLSYWVRILFFFSKDFATCLFFKFIHSHR